MSAEGHRVVITGLGLLTPLGVGTDETWQGLVEGRSAVGPIAGYDASSLRTQVGAEILDLAPKEFVSRRALRTMTRYDMLAAVAAALAMRDSGLEVGEDPEGRAALFTASGKEISKPEHFEEIAVEVRGDGGRVDMRKFGTLAPSAVHPLFFIEGIQGASLFYLSEAFGLRGAQHLLLRDGRGGAHRDRARRFGDSPRGGRRRAGGGRGRAGLLVEHGEDRPARADHRLQRSWGRRLPAVRP